MGGQDDINKALCRAADEGNLTLVEYYCQMQRIDVNFKTAKGGTPLHAAAYRGHTEVIDHLLRQPLVDVNLRFDGATPLYTACFRGHVKAVKMLLEDDRVEVNKATTTSTSQVLPSDVTPLWIAAKNGFVEVVSLLLASRQDVDTKMTSTGNIPAAEMAGQTARDSNKTVEMRERYSRIENLISCYEERKQEVPNLISTPTNKRPAPPASEGDASPEGHVKRKKNLSIAPTQTGSSNLHQSIAGGRLFPPPAIPPLASFLPIIPSSSSAGGTSKTFTLIPKPALESPLGQRPILPTPSAPKRIENQSCEAHPFSPMNRYCATCDRVTCSECLADNHSSHTFHHVNDAVKGFKADIEGYRHDVKKRRTEAAEVLETLSPGDLATGKEISDHFTILLEDLTKRRDELLENLARQEAAVVTKKEAMEVVAAKLKEAREAFTKAGSVTRRQSN